MHPGWKRTHDPQWELVASIKGGHRFYQTTAMEDGVAIADDSGSGPHDTDDGWMFLDSTRPITFDSRSRVFSLPIIDIANNPYSTPCSWDEAVYCANRWGYRFQTSLERTDKPGLKRQFKVTEVFD